MKLPKSFTAADKYNVKGGVEFGFMSTTLDRGVAEKYSKGASNAPSLILEMRMGMVNRGAFLGWISQYPHEAEILIPPLCGLEVLSSGTLADGTMLFTMGLNLNLRSMTIEQVLAVRKKQCVELVSMIKKDLGARDADGDVPRRLHDTAELLAEIEATDFDRFNDNAKFAATSSKLLAQLPRTGDEIGVMQAHARPVLALAALRHTENGTEGAPAMVSGSVDGRAVEHGGALSDGTNNVQTFTADGGSVPTPVLCLTVLEPMPMVAAGLFSGKIVVAGLQGSTFRRELHGHGGAVTSLAWEPSKKCLASGSADCRVLVWELDGMPELPRYCELTAHGDTVRGLCWVELSSSATIENPLLLASLPRETTEHLASVAFDGSVRLWDVHAAQIGSAMPLVVELASSSAERTAVVPIQLTTSVKAELCDTLEALC
eukprot:SAG11_NODE_3278_length_2557_cov_2.015813_3_plen_430_part_01